jgi:hypothetical protein
MAAYNLIATTTVGSGGVSSIVFSGIPQTYTDLQLVYSARSSRAAVGDDGYVRFNSSSSNLSSLVLYGTGSSALSFYDGSIAYVAYFPANNSTASVFGNGSIYIPNYAGSTYKSISGDVVTENNAATAFQEMCSGLWSSTAAITSLAIFALNGNLMEYSSASLYGIKNS